VEASLKGQLLVAAPGLLDPNFVRTVVLLLEHNDEGALGVVLNRPTNLDVADPLPLWRPVAATPAVIFAGGPVGDGVAIGLGRLNAVAVAPLAPTTADDAGFAPLFGPLASVDLARSPDDIAGLELVRIFAGYAGWTGGQLEDEIEQGGWIIVEALPDDALAPEPDDLWRAVLKRQPGTMSWLANFPLDPRMN